MVGQTFSDCPNLFKAKILRHQYNMLDVVRSGAFGIKNTIKFWV